MRIRTGCFFAEGKRIPELAAEMVFPTHPLMADLVNEPLVVDRTGQIELSEKPGLGIELNPRVVAKFRVDK